MNDSFWAGSEEAFNVVESAKKSVQEGVLAGRFSTMSEEDLPSLWYKQGNIGVVEIKGSLIDGSSGWMRMFGVTGYNDIAQAAIQATSDPEVKAVLYHINSGGGQVNGMYETRDLLSKLSSMKSSSVFTSTGMASAAYALGSAVNGPLQTSLVAENGSIGVLRVHTEYSKADLADGVTKTILRSGENKALMNPIEPLSDKARAEAESQLRYMHDIFIKAVRDSRPNMSADQLANATDGKTFLGKQGVTAGLVDKVGTFDQALKLLDNNKTSPDTSSKPKGGVKMDIILTAEQIALIQAGLPLSEIVADANPETPSIPVIVPAAAPVVATVTPIAGAPAVFADTGVIDLLKSQLVTAQAQLVTAQAELVNLKATTQSQTANHDGLLAIARSAVSSMLIPMGGTEASAMAMDAATAISEYARVKPLFLDKFKVGQQSAAIKAETKDKAVEIDPMFLARLKHTPSASK